MCVYMCAPFLRGVCMSQTRVSESRLVFKFKTSVCVGDLHTHIHTEFDVRVHVRAPHIAARLACVRMSVQPCTFQVVFYLFFYF